MTETAAKYEVDLACPFCGSSDSQRSTLYVESEGTELVPVGDIGEVETVSCNACWAEAPVHIWNGRAAKDAEIARLREALEQLLRFVYFVQDEYDMTKLPEVVKARAALRKARGEG